MRNITEFKKGDVITRITPAKPYKSGVCDRSYIGEKLVFIGIANGCIYVIPFGDVSLNYNDLQEKTKRLSLDFWSDGWDCYVELYELILADLKPAIELV